MAFDIAPVDTAINQATWTIPLAAVPAGTWVLVLDIPFPASQYLSCDSSVQGTGDIFNFRPGSDVHAGERIVTLPAAGDISLTCQGSNVAAVPPTDLAGTVGLIRLA